MPIRFRCTCGKIVKIGEEYAGRRATCPNCGAQLVVPSASTTPEAGGPNAQVAPPAPPPEPPAPELQLESEPSAPPGKRSDAVEEPMELESEPSGPGGETDETVLEVVEVEEPAPGPESSEAAAAPAESAPAPAPSEPAPERVCPNCGVAAAPQSVICVECGAKLAPEKASAKKPSGIAKAFQSLREHKAFPLIASVAAVVVILIATVVIIEVRKSRKPAPVQAVWVPPKPPPATAPKVAEKPKPPVEFHWPGFSDPAAIARDRILKAGRLLAGFLDRNHQAPATLTEAGVAEADSAEYNYLGAEIAALPRFHAMAYEAKPSASYDPYVLFSDCSARPVPVAQIPSVLLKKTDSGWATAADADLLAKTAPVIRVDNVRFASLEVALDDKPAGVAPRGGECLIPATAGAHQLTFAAGGQKEGFAVDLKPGIVYTFVHPWQINLPFIPMRQYRMTLAAPPPPPAPLPGQPAPPPVRLTTPPGQPAPPPAPVSPFTVDRKEGFAVKSLKSPTQSVDFLDGDGRSILTSDLRSLTARITRENENLTIEGPAPGKPMLIDEIGRLEAGIVRFKGDLTVTFRKTALGALRCEELPNTDPAAVSLPETEQGKSPALKLGLTTPWSIELPPVTPGATPVAAPPRNLKLGAPAELIAAMRLAKRPGQGAPPAVVEVPTQLAFPAATFTLTPDCEALAGSLSSSAPAAVALLLQRAQLEPKSAEGAPAPAAVRETPPPAGRFTNAPRGRRGGFGPFPRTPQVREPAAGKMAEAAERPLLAQEIPARLVYAALAFYGDPSAFHVLTLQCEKTPPDSPAYPPLLLALARCGGTSALAYLRTASANAPTSAVIALCMINDDAARNALAEILANWTPGEVAEAVNEWPVVAGPACRITFVQTLASAHPALLDNLTVLDALMKFDPFTLERVLAARLEAELGGPPATSQPPATPQPPPKASAPAPGRRGSPPTARRGPPPAATNRPAPAPADALAVRSTAALYWIALAHLKNGAAVARFVQLLGGDNDPPKRLRAAAALGEVRDPSIVPLLTTLLQDKDVSLRRAAARGLAQMPDAAVVGTLDAAMDKNLLLPSIVEQAPAMAAKAGAEATAALLAKMLTVAVGGKPPAPAPAAKSPPGRGPAPPPPAPAPEEPGMATPMMILGALNRLGLYSPPVKTALEAAREAPDPAVRAAAYKAREQAIAGVSARERSLSAVAAAGLALKDPQGSVRCAGIALLSAAEPAAALTLLLPAVKDSDADVRAAAISALPEIADDPRIAAAIAGSLSDSNPAVVSVAARAAARRRDPALGAAVLAALNQARGKPTNPSAALGSLAEAAAALQPPGAAGALANLLAYPQPDVRAAAARALGKLKDATALNSLLSAMQDKDPSVVSAAIGALGEFDAPDAVKPTLDALVGKEVLPEDLRRQILARLAAHCADPNSAYGSWMAKGPALKDSDWAFLVSVAPSATPAVRPGLIALATQYLADPQPETKRRAASILANCADNEAVRTMLLKALEQDAAGVAEAAADVLRRVRDEGMIEGTLLAYYRALCETPGGPGGPGGLGPRAGMAGGARMFAPQRPGMPRGAAPAAPQPPRFPGLAKATAEESYALRAAIIDALGGIGGDRAGRALKTIAELEQKRSNEDMALHLIAAFESSKASTSVRDLCELFLDKPGPHTPDAIAALTRMASLDPTRLTDTLTRLVRGGTTPPDVAAAAVDAMEQIQGAGGA